MQIFHPKDLFSEQSEMDYIRDTGRVIVDALYLSSPVLPRGCVLPLDQVSDLPEFKNLDPDSKPEDKRTIEDRIRKEPDKFRDIISHKRELERARGMCYALHERGSDTNSPDIFQYRVFAASFDEISQGFPDFSPAFVIVNIYAAEKCNTNVRKQVTSLADEAEVPIIIYAPNGRDENASENFERIKKEWNAACGFVAGDAQWDGVMTVAETQFGFMGYAARDYLHNLPSVKKAAKEFAKRPDIEKLLNARLEETSKDPDNVDLALLLFFESL